MLFGLEFIYFAILLLNLVRFLSAPPPAQSWRNILRCVQGMRFLKREIAISYACFLTFYIIE